ncbi:TonB family protein [Flagellimonas iocasae]|uniref:TonB family protein n=1 Tax=Flagellimonas iocasae TaxID=2055905 RepID=A0ABW4XYS3_9FLAO
MITYILESLAFQLVFLLTYDLFLKKETFFNWNRAYLLGTFVLSLILPWVKIQALQTTMPQEFETTTVFLTQLNGVVLGPGAEKTSFLASIPWPYWVLGVGSLLAAGLFTYKLIQIGRLRKKSSIQHYTDFTKVTVPKSTTAFSFFRNVFLGEEIKKDRESNILAHELVHVKQLHSLDLVFFELARILFWFNPLVYVYQNRVAELHEFIADAQAVKQDKAAHFEMLLSEAFNTQNISFVNQFFNRSLIKKRIVMLQKQKSKSIWQLKYILLLPLVLTILVYNSCETEKDANSETTGAVPLDEVVIVGFEIDDVKTFTLNVTDLDALTEQEESYQSELLDRMVKNDETGAVNIVDKSGRTIKIGVKDGKIFNMSVNKQTQSSLTSVPFNHIEEVPVFPGCEDAEDKKACFQEKMQRHIRKHFMYPEEAAQFGIQGRVNVIFDIASDGYIKNIRMRGPHELLENEALRMIEKLPKMQPGKQDGKAVDVPFSIPITFRIPSTTSSEKKPEVKGNMQVTGSLSRENNTTLYQGKVTDENALGIPGVTISVKGTERGGSFGL